MRMMAAALALLMSTAQAAYLESHVGPLPILDGIYGNLEGCLMAHGDAPEGPALWLTRWEIQTAEAHCDIVYWELDQNGALSIDCGARKFLIMPRTAVERMMLVVELTGAQSFMTYQLRHCGPE
jgi:hypothetical protein